MIDAPAGLMVLAEIGRLKAQYVRALEERDWNLYADCLTESVVASFAPAVGESDSIAHHGRTHLREWIADALSETYVVMRVSSPDIDVIDVDHAAGTWAFVERLYSPSGPYRQRTFYGHYHERYERCTDGRWRIASLRVARVRHDVSSEDGCTAVFLDAR